MKKCFSIGNEKAVNLLLFKCNGFSLVAGTGEISNFDLVKDIQKVIEYLDYLKSQACY